MNLRRCEVDSLVYEMHYKTIFHYTYYLVGKKELAEDITQSTFIKAYKKMNMLESYGQRIGLYKIACNLVNAYFRRAKMNQILDANNAKNPAATIYEPESWLQSEAEDYALYKAVGQLSLDVRQAIVLRNIEGFSVQQCAEILKWNEAKVENTIDRGMNKLKELIGEAQSYKINRLQTIKKMDLSEEQIMRGKEDLQRTLIARKNQIGPIIVCITIYAMLLFSLFIPLQKKESAQQVPSTTEIDNVILLYNAKPERKLDLHSIHYINKLSISDEERTVQVMDMLPATLANPVEWDGGMGDEFGVYDMQVTYLDGISVYYKVHIASPSTLIDVENQMKYVIPQEIEGDFHSFIWTNLDENYTVNRYEVIALIVVFAIILIINWRYRKKYVIRNENNKEKTLNGWLSFIGGVVFIFPISYSPYIIGTVHAGFMAISILAYVFIISRLETYFEVMKPNAAFYRYIFPVYVVVIFTMILIII